MVTLNLTETDKAYLAGIFDGEGTVGYYLRKIYANGRKCHSASVIIANSDPRLMLWIMNKLQFGRLKLAPGGKSQVMRRHHAYRWESNKRPEIEALLFAVRPYLKIKGEQVDVLFELWSKDPTQWGKKSVTPEVEKMRDDVVARMHQLKTSNMNPIH